jgi:ATP dependent DNA ligase domain|nr:MAG TPA: Thermostable DNA ligase [Caudoviricetes sp.]
MSKVLMKGVSIKRGDELGFPVIAEEKLDGVRCLVQVQGNRVNYISYAGKELHNLSDYDDLWIRIRDETDKAMFDCEFMYLDFDSTYKVVRSKKRPEWFDRLHGCFYILDSPARVTSYQSHQNWLQEIADSGYPAIRRPDSRVCHNLQEVQELFHRVVKRGGEGLMLKDPAGQYYQGGRSKVWGKLKRQETLDGQIMFLYEAFDKYGQAKGEVGSFTVRFLLEGDTVWHTVDASASRLTLSERRNMWANRQQLKDKWCEVQYMQVDRAGGLRHPVFLRIREDKE